MKGLALCPQSERLRGVTTSHLQSPWGSARASPGMASLLVTAPPGPGCPCPSLPQAWIPTAPPKKPPESRGQYNLGTRPPTGAQCTGIFSRSGGCLCAVQFPLPRRGVGYVALLVHFCSCPCVWCQSWEVTVKAPVRQLFPSCLVSESPFPRLSLPSARGATLTRNVRARCETPVHLLSPARGCPASPAPSEEETVLPPRNSLDSLAQGQVTIHMQVLSSLSTLFHWPTVSIEEQQLTTQLKMG